MHCTHSLNGEGCFKCAIFCTKFREEGILTRPTFDDNLSRTCDVMCASASALYYFIDKTQ